MPKLLCILCVLFLSSSARSEPVIAVFEDERSSPADQSRLMGDRIRWTMGNFLRPKNYYILSQSEQLMLLEAANFPREPHEKASASYADWFLVYTLSFQEQYSLEVSLFNGKGVRLDQSQIQVSAWLDLDLALRALLYRQLQKLLMQPKPAVLSPPMAVQKILLFRQEDDLRKSWHRFHEDTAAFGKAEEGRRWIQRGKEIQRQFEDAQIEGTFPILVYADEWLENTLRAIPKAPVDCSSMKDYQKSLGKKGALHWDGTLLSFSHGTVEMLWDVAQACIPNWDCAQSERCQTGGYDVRFFYDNGPRMQLLPP
ncbi:MAG: hypothetical protein VX278_02545 [Myxococcota bacterium]|nr:hypothetical protein [Myxococcota bacterium]